LPVYQVNTHFYYMVETATAGFQSCWHLKHPVRLCKWFCLGPVLLLPGKMQDSLKARQD
jgi:hypothetical protein